MGQTRGARQTGLSENSESKPELKVTKDTESQSSKIKQNLNQLNFINFLDFCLKRLLPDIAFTETKQPQYYFK